MFYWICRLAGCNAIGDEWVSGEMLFWLVKHTRLCTRIASWSGVKNTTKSTRVNTRKKQLTENTWTTLNVWGRLISCTRKGSHAHAHSSKFSYARLYVCRDVEFKLNQFADLSEDEFRKYILMYPRVPPRFNQNIVKWVDLCKTLYLKLHTLH